ncbi:MAG: aminotransferase class I/II-fold pyridoxal phosphate-dependent enzyme, partial [Candidatus Micrarchaeota archaeon]
RKSINGFTRAILVINPNNPTGAVYSRKSLQGIIDIAGEHKLPIISDDVYDQLVFDGEMHHIKDMAKDVPVVSGNSLSKNYIYPGARVGYLAFHGPGWDKIKDAVQRLCNQRLSVNWEMQRAYIAALKGPHDHIKDFNAALKVRRDVVAKRVDSIDGLSMPKPKGAFYAFVNVEGPWKNDVTFVRELLKHGVVVVPGSGFAPRMKGKAFRLVFLPKPEQLEQAFDRIEACMKSVKG